MNYLSVCSGIEAATVAWHDIGWNPVGFSEIEPFPSAVLSHHYPDVANFGDMTKFKEWNLDPNRVDLLVGGTPCQSFSVAGLRKGLDDPRGNLALTYCSMLDHFRPTWFIWENVPGVLSSSGGRDFCSFLGAVAELGYGFAYRVLDAQYFGVAQRRRRVFVVGYLGNWQRAAAVLFERQSLCRDTAPRREKGEVAPTIHSRSTAGGGLGTDFDCDGGLIQTFCRQSSGEYGTQPVASTVAARDYKSASDLVCVHGTQDPCASNEVAFALGRNSGQENVIAHHLPFDTTQITSKANYSNPKVGDPCHPLSAGAHPPAIAVALRGSEGGDKAHVLTPVAYTNKLHNTKSNNAGKLFEERSPCLDANSPAPALLTPMYVRRLTPIECERLQGFPDNYTNIPWRKKDESPDGPRYKALGNSMAVPVMRWIGERINQVKEIV